MKASSEARSEKQEARSQTQKSEEEGRSELVCFREADIVQASKEDIFFCVL
jgi:hypothetical protein